MLLFIYGLTKYVKQGKDELTRLVQEYDAGKAKCSLPKEANLIKQKYMTEETAAQNIKKNQLQFRIENEKTEGLQSKPMHE
jgi:hypothetical protein